MRKIYNKVLLISDMEEEYNELIKYGFQRVDYFKSIVRADKYFKNNPEKLEEYELVILGNQVNRHSSFKKIYDLNRTLKKMNDENKTLVISIYNYDLNKSQDGFLVAHLTDKDKHEMYFPRFKSYSLLYDAIVQNAHINNAFSIKKESDEFIPIEDHVNAVKLDLPKKISDLKILFLDEYLRGDYPEKIKKELGINLTAEDDGNSSLGEYVQPHLGEYDIIIASSRFSSNLMEMNHESTEQCKDTGRRLTLLVTYNKEDKLIFDEDKICHTIGTRISLNSIFGGELSKGIEPKEVEFMLLAEKYKNPQLDSKEQLILECETNMKNIIEQTIYLYNDALLKVENRDLEDLNYKTIEELNNEYYNVIALEEQRKEKALEPIYKFHSFKKQVLKYLEYRNLGLVIGEPKGLKIIETDSEASVCSIDNNKTNGVLTFEKEYNQYNLRIFSLQIPLKRDTLIEPEIILLTDPQTVGLYTKGFENKEGVPNRPTPEQMRFIDNMFEKADINIKPINDEIYYTLKNQKNIEKELVKEAPENTKKLSLFKRFFRKQSS